MLDYSHPTDMAVSAILERDWESAQASTVRQRGGLPDMVQNSLPDPRELLSFSKSLNREMVTRESDILKTQHCSKQEDMLLFSL